MNYLVNINLNFHSTINFVVSVEFLLLKFQIYKLWPDTVPSKFVTVPAPSGFLVSTAALNNTLYTDGICL